MLLLLVGVAVAAFLYWRKRRLYRAIKTHAQERLAQSTLRTHTGNVTAAPVDPPLATVTPLWPRLVDDQPRDAA